IRHVGVVNRRLTPRDRTLGRRRRSATERPRLIEARALTEVPSPGDALECLSSRTKGRRANYSPRGAFDGQGDCAARFGEGFRSPAPCRRVMRALGPAFESLPRRKPRGGRALLGRELWGFAGGGRLACDAAVASDGESWRRNRRRRRFSITELRGCVAFAVVG